MGYPSDTAALGRSVLSSRNADPRMAIDGMRESKGKI